MVIYSTLRLNTSSLEANKPIARGAEIAKKDALRLAWLRASPFPH